MGWGEARMLRPPTFANSFKRMPCEGERLWENDCTFALLSPATQHAAHTYDMCAFTMDAFWDAMAHSESN